MPETMPDGANVRIRQVALCTDDVWREERRILAFLGVAGVHRDPPNVFEMRNTVFAVGDSFLEVLQPTSTGAPSARFLERNGGPGGYMLILQVADLDAARRRVDDLGIRIVHEQTPTRVHGIECAALHLHPRDTGGTLISLDHMATWDDWAWAGAAWKGHVHTDTVAGIVGVELASATPDELVARLGALVDRIPDGRTLDLDGTTIAVIEAADGTRDHLAAVVLSATDRSLVGTEQMISGTPIRFV